jgi:hypothetical protein
MHRWFATLALVALALLSRTGRADTPETSETIPSTRPADSWLVHANFGVPVVSYFGTMGKQSAGWITPGDRLTTVQLVGAGYWVHPHLRANLALQFAETLSGIPSSASSFTSMGAIAWAAYTEGPFFAGLGGVVAPRSYGTWDADAGIFTCVGVAVPLGGGFSFGGAVQAPIMLARRVALVVSPAVLLSYRF